MRKTILALLAGLLLCAQSPMVPGFPPGTFQNRAAIDAAPAGASYTGPGDVIASADSWWGFRAYSAAKAAATANVADLVAVTGGAAVCTLKLATDGTADMVGSYCAGTTVAAACAAASGGSCKISKIYDQVSTRDLDQATLASMPAFSATAQNSKPGATFSGSQCIASSNTITRAQAFTISMALIPNGKSATQASWMANNGSSIQAGADRSVANNAFHYASAAVPTATMSDGAAHAVQFIFNNASSGINVDDTLTSASLGSALGLSSDIVIVGGRAADCTGGQVAIGSWLEAGIWSGAWSSGQQTSMCGNQRSYWATGGSC